MASNLEPSGAGSSLTARRSATSNLPSFELPPPPRLQQKYHSFSNINSNGMSSQHAPATISVGNLLTPPTTIPGDNLSPISSGVNSVSPAAAQGLPPYPPTNYWPSQPGSGNTPYPFSGTGTTPQPWQNSLNPLFASAPRGLFSPSLGSLVRSSGSPAAEGLPPPPYDLNQLPPFPSSTSMSMSTSANLPAITNQQTLPQTYMNVQTSVPPSAAQPSPVNAPDSYLQRPPPTPSYYNGSQPSSTPQQTHFPAFQSASPVQQSQIGLAASGSRMPNGGQPTGMQQAGVIQHGNHYVRPPYSYSLPTINSSGITGPIMSNVHSPGGQMSMIGALNHGLPGGMMAGFNSGHSAQMQQMYGSQQQTPHNERPFKCDQCPQSFNRNHDLKRHKRIHLAVKPFPCGHCEKSFSRKDALKRHILVKGCGKNQPPLSNSKDGESLSPVDKSEVMSSDNDESPTLANSI